MGRKKKRGKKRSMRGGEIKEKMLELEENELGVILSARHINVI